MARAEDNGGGAMTEEQAAEFMAGFWDKVVEDGVMWDLLCGIR